ncbi:unnamed protein product [Thlaspi arvense]|uniref:Uncharacterized protein n=1 Tax=Thlaspi arvense TaxID=13288 RepID=A0AAU9RVC7_THLAR|nr:unnamed protein product [Thlaspi arvense]
MESLRGWHGTVSLATQSLTTLLSKGSSNLATVVMHYKFSNIWFLLDIQQCLISELSWAL